MKRSESWMVERDVLVKMAGRLASWVEDPTDLEHKYTERFNEEAESDPSVARSESVQALMDAGIIAEYMDNLIPELIGMARSEGETWEGIGESLGISRQAAQQRFAAWEKAQANA